MKTVAIIQARMGSTRLPGKVLRSLAGDSVLAHVISRVRLARRLDAVWVATSDTPSDTPIVEEASRLGVGCFRGSEEDVLSRFAGAAQAAAAEVVVRVTADCPLFDGELLEAMLERFFDPPPVDYLSNVLERSYPRGLDAEIFTAEALREADRKAYSAHEREHVTPYLYQNAGRFRLRSFRGADDLSQYRWTLDTRDDWAFVEAVYERLHRPGHIFNTAEALKLLKANPELAMLNAHVEQKKLGT